MIKGKPSTPACLLIGFVVTSCGGESFQWLFASTEGGAPVAVDVVTVDARAERLTTEPMDAAIDDTAETSSQDVATGEASNVDVWTPCVPGPEICNGSDDNCNGTIDEGCPTSLVWDAAIKRKALGDSTGGSEFTDTCDGDEVLVGLRATMGSWVGQVQGVCRKLTVARSGSTMPYEYELQFGASRDLSPHPPSMTGQVGDLTCSGKKILVGIRISQQHYTSPEATSYVVIPSIWATCAEPVLKLGAMPPRVEWQSAAEIGPLSGSFADGTAWFEQDAIQSPTVLVGLHGGAGSWVDRIGVSSATIGVALR